MYQVRIEKLDYDSGWYDFQYAGKVGDFVANVLPTFDGEATFTIREVKDKEEEDGNTVRTY